MPLIDDIGIDEYLNQTAAQHNNFDFEAFVVMLKQKVDKANIARAFGVSRNTVYSWLQKYKNMEQKNAKATNTKPTNGL